MVNQLVCSTALHGHGPTRDEVRLAFQKTCGSLNMSCLCFWTVPFHFQGARRHLEIQKAKQQNDLCVVKNELFSTTKEPNHWQALPFTPLAAVCPCLRAYWEWMIRNWFDVCMSNMPCDVKNVQLMTIHTMQVQVKSSSMFDDMFQHPYWACTYIGRTRLMKHIST